MRELPIAVDFAQLDLASAEAMCFELERVYRSAFRDITLLRHQETFLSKHSFKDKMLSIFNLAENLNVSCVAELSVVQALWSDQVPLEKGGHFRACVSVSMLRTVRRSTVAVVSAYTPEGQLAPAEVRESLLRLAVGSGIDLGDMVNPIEENLNDRMSYALGVAYNAALTWREERLRLAHGDVPLDRRLH